MSTQILLIIFHCYLIKKFAFTISEIYKKKHMCETEEPLELGQSQSIIVEDVRFVT